MTEQDIGVRARAIAYNEHSKWWHSLTDSHRRALLRGTLSMGEQAFLAGVEAALRSTGGEDHPVFAFLLGEGELDGQWFADAHYDPNRGTFWWRKHLREALSDRELYR